MKLKKVRIQNFRCYDDISVDVDDMTTIIGKNDIGKSTILEALEIFFNNEIVKIEPSDANIHGADKTVTITCDFCNLPDKLVLDADAETTLEDEYLIIASDTLRVSKQFDCSKTKVPELVLIHAMHPNLSGQDTLLGLKETELKKLIKDNGVDSKQKGNPTMRKALWNFYHASESLSEQDIPVSLTGAKSIWENLQQYLPVYALFQSDRSSLDSDDEVQDPMKSAIKEALRGAEAEIQAIQEKVQDEAMRIANETFEALKTISPDLACDLQPKFTLPTQAKWNGLFSVSMNTDEGIPLNKRGSGVRRMILVSFFKAAAERRSKDESKQDVIYAIEEPETGQHPNNQKILIDSFLELSNSEHSQIILTTHSPNLAKELPMKSIRFIGRDDANQPVIESGAQSDDVIVKVAEALGVLSDVHPHVQVVICVEGPTDIVAMKCFNRCLHEQYPDLVDIEKDERILIIPLGGSILKHWTDYQYLKKMGSKEFHIYDRDVARYQDTVNQINDRGDGSWAELTSKYEIENYLHTKAIKEQYDVDVDTDQQGVPELFGEAYSSKMEYDGKMKGKRAKGLLSAVFNNSMSYALLAERDPHGEIKGWFDKIESMLH
ncbi:MAG: ATP-binding protein [Prevotella sp.]|nr:ATP-binding protein [Prevotella sp.]